MIKRVRHKISTMNRTQKSVIAAILFGLLVGVALLAFGNNENTATPNTGVTTNAVIDTSTGSVATTYITNDEYYIKYNGYDLQLESVQKTCSDCYTTIYSYKINTPLLIKSIHGFRAIIEIENNTVTTARYIRM